MVDCQGIGTASELMDGGDLSLNYLAELLERLKAYGFINCTVDFGVARGLDYYTGMVFEIDSPSLGAEKQICKKLRAIFIDSKASSKYGCSINSQTMISSMNKV